MDAELAPRALTVDAFCRAYAIGRSTLYRLIKDNAGPRTMKVGRRTLISIEAADEWRRRMEASQRNRA
jgi:excisionase family DNA binding protein